MAQPHRNLLATVAEGAAIVGVGERKFQDLRKTPGFPEAIALGPRCLRFRVADLEAWVASRPTVQQQREPIELALSRKRRQIPASETSGEPPANRRAPNRKLA